MSTRSIFRRAVAGSVLLGTSVGSVFAGTDSFDSVQEFSASQGAGNWQYGYYLTAGDSSSFVQMVHYSAAFVDAWSESVSSPPWTLLWAAGGHPNGSNSGAEHDAVRRWTSGAVGTVNIAGTYSMANVGGTRVGVIADNSPIWTDLVTSTPQSFVLSRAVVMGTHLDFYINSNGVDFNDSTHFAVAGQVTAVPEPESLALLLAGLAGLGVLGRVGKGRRAG